MSDKNSPIRKAVLDLSRADWGLAEIASILGISLRTAQRVMAEKRKLEAELLPVGEAFRREFDREDL